MSDEEKATPSFTSEEADYRPKLLTFIQAWVPIAAVCVAGIWQLYTYKANEIQADKALAYTQRIDAQRPFLVKKMDIYFDAAQTVGILQNLETGTPEWKKTADRFWALRWSELELVGDPGIRQATRRVQRALLAVQKESNEATRHSLRWATECLADEMRLSLETSWHATPNAEKTVTGDIRRSLPSGCTMARREIPKDEDD